MRSMVEGAARGDAIFHPDQQTGVRLRALERAREEAWRNRAKNRD
jgi:hypothetical protein